MVNFGAGYIGLAGRKDGWPLGAWPEVSLKEAKDDTGSRFTLQSDDTRARRKKLKYSLTGILSKGWPENGLPTIGESDTISFAEADIYRLIANIYPDKSAMCRLVKLYALPAVMHTVNVSFKSAIPSCRNICYEFSYYL